MCTYAHARTLVITRLFHLFAVSLICLFLAANVRSARCVSQRLLPTRRVTRSLEVASQATRSSTSRLGAMHEDRLFDKSVFARNRRLRD